MNSNSILHSCGAEICGCTAMARPWARTYLILLLAFATSLSASAAIEIMAPQQQQDAYFGASVVGLADFTGDGIGELAISALGYDQDGAVFIFNGRDFSRIRTVVSPNPQPPNASQFGGSLAEGPDLNNDGVPDLVVGAVWADRPDSQAAGYGQAYVIDPATGTNLLTLSAPRTYRGTQFGSRMATLPTTIPGENSRIAVSAPAGTGLPGSVHLLDATSGELILSFNSPMPVSGGFFGTSLAPVGDLDGDGRTDLGVGVGNYAGENATPGAAFVFSGQTGQLLHQLIPPDLPGITRHRWDVAGVPDVNGDETPDVIVGVPLASPAGALLLEGRAYIFSGVDGTCLRIITSPAPQVRGFFGWFVKGLPDMTGDRVGELLIGGSGRPAIGSLGERRVHLINGATGKPIQTFASPTLDEPFGGENAGLFDRASLLRGIASATPVASAPGAPVRAGRAYAFPVGRLGVERSASGFALTLTSYPDFAYEIQISSNLTNWTTFTNAVAATGEVRFVHLPTNGFPRHFFRALEVNP